MAIQKPSIPKGTRDFGQLEMTRRRIRERLTELNYYTTKITEKYDDKTVKAVKAFQTDFGLEETGEADLATLSLNFSLNLSLNFSLNFGRLSLYFVQ